MKVFISWSGPHSERLGEVLRDWLPNVLQHVRPYFTPSDIEKGARWSTDIAKELDESHMGILCVTRDNIHSDWLLFEAGALSKSLEKSHVCPVLFGITNTDITGPLKQFQTAVFEKGDILQLLGVINGGSGDSKLPQKTLDTVFEKWWPDLEEKINRLLADVDEPEEPVRKDRELLEEILQLSRTASLRSGPTPTAVRDLLGYYIALHNQESAHNGTHQDTLNRLQKMQRSVASIAKYYRGRNGILDELIDELGGLSYTVQEREAEAEEHDDRPF